MTSITDIAREALALAEKDRPSRDAETFAYALISDGYKAQTARKLAHADQHYATLASAVIEQAETIGRLRSRLRLAIDSNCSCGGSGPNDHNSNVCVACRIWHEVNRAALSPRAEKEQRT